MRKILFFLLIAALSYPIYSQKILTLEESLSIAMKESYTAQAANFSLLSSRKSLESQTLALRSQVSMSLNVSNSSTLQSYQVPSDSTLLTNYYHMNITSVSPTLTISQPIMFTNGTLTFTGSLTGNRQVSLSSNTTDNYYSNFIVSLRQPLFQLNTQARAYEAAEINLKKAERTYQQAEMNITYTVSQAFYNLVKTKKSLDIAKEKARQTEEQYKTASNKFNAGFIAEDQALQLEVDFASSKNELLNAIQNYEDSKNDFKILIGLPLSENIEVEGDVDYKPVDVNVDEAVNSALKNRPEIMNAESDIYLSGLSVEEVEARNKIKAELNASYGVNKTADDFKRIFNAFYDSRSINLSVNIPIFDWGKNSLDVEVQKASYDQSKLALINQKESIKKEIISSVNRLNSSKARIEILVKSVKIAEKSYGISSERFKSGSITSFELSQSQINLTQAKLSYLEALIDYKLSITDLERKTLMKIE